MGKKSHIIFTDGNRTVVCVYLLSAFVALSLVLNFCVERILRTGSQKTKETDRNVIHNDYRILTDMAAIAAVTLFHFQTSSLKFPA